METATAPAISPASYHQATLTWATNTANKLSRHTFYHLDLAPAQMPARSKVEQTIFTITTADQSHPPVQAQLVHIQVIDWHRLTDHHTQTAEGLTLGQFADYIFAKHPYSKLSRSKLAMYTYQKAPVFFGPF